MSPDYFNPILADDSDDEGGRFSSLPKEGRKLPIAIPNRSQYENILAEDEEDEPDLRLLKKEDVTDYKENADPIEKKIEERYFYLKDKFPGGGWRALQLLTLDILLSMPENWLDRFTADVAEGTKWTQQQLAIRERSDAIAQAVANPTKNEYQDAAFRAVQSIFTEYLDKNAVRGIDRFILLSLVASEIIGLSVIDPLWREEEVEEIIINGPKDIQVGMHGQYIRVKAAKFRDSTHVLQMLERIFSSINKQLSPTTPLLRGRLHDQSRILAVHPYVAPEGPNVAIRRHPDEFWTPEKLVQLGSFSPEVGTWLGNMIYKGCSFVVIGGTSTGKALSHDTKIRTPYGTTSMGDIKVGDEILDRFGNLGKVTRKFPQPPRQVYKITLETGEALYADLEHNWLVESGASRGATKEAKRIPRFSRTQTAGLKRALSLEDKQLRQGELLSVLGEEKAGRSAARKVFLQLAGNEKTLSSHTFANGALAIAEDLPHDQRSYENGYKVKTTAELIELLKRDRYYLPRMTQAVHYADEKEPEDLPIHPYLLGLWLGDGTSGKAVLAASPKDRKEYLKNFAALGIASELTPLKNKMLWKITQKDFREKLIDLGIFFSSKQKEGFGKRIPASYKFSSPKSRQLLLQGLIDSDGSTNANGHWTFTNTNEELARGFFEVASSLGLKTKIGSWNYTSPKKEGKTAFVITVVDLIKLSRLSRKLESQRKKRSSFKNANRTDALRIVSIEPTERVEEMSCITVDTPDSTYLVGDGFVTTHNTSFLNAMTGFYRDDVRLLTLEDNLEMKPNPKKMLAAAMESKPGSAENTNDGVTMRDLVRASIQGLAPDGLIIGEVTDGAAYDLVQALNTGHFGASTIHANSEFDGIYRIASLVQQGADLSQDQTLPLIAAAFDFVILLEHFPEDGSRRVTSISEVDPYTTKKEGESAFLGVNQIWKFVADGKKPDVNGDLKIYGHWEQTGEMSEIRKERRHLNLIEDLTWEQLKEVSSIPEWALEKKKKN